MEVSGECTVGGSQGTVITPSKVVSSVIMRNLGWDNLGYSSLGTDFHSCSYSEAPES